MSNGNLPFIRYNLTFYTLTPYWAKERQTKLLGRGLQNIS